MPTTDTPRRHPEAFRLLRYRCEACGFVEVVWNSRDGAVVYEITCAAAIDVTGVHAKIYRETGMLAVAPHNSVAGRLTFAPATVHVIDAGWPGRADALQLRACGGLSTHVYYTPMVGFDPWGPDTLAPDHDPLPGDRYFRDGIPAEARAIARMRIEEYRANHEGAILPGGLRMPPMTDEWASDLLRRASEGTPSPGDQETRPPEFAPGWPMLVVRGTDADALPARCAQ